MISFEAKCSDLGKAKSDFIRICRLFVDRYKQIKNCQIYICYNPSDNALRELKKAHNNDSVKRKTLTLKEQEIFENYLRNSEKYNNQYPLFTVMLWTGMRVGEITGLRWCDVDFEAELINVNHTLVYYSKGKKNGLVYAVNSPKTEAGKRESPMLPKVKEALLQEKRS